MYDEENMPVFIKIENYKEVIELLHMIKGKVDEANDYLERIHALKSEEDEKINEWSEVVKDVEKKVGFVNSSLMKPKIK